MKINGNMKIIKKKVELQGIIRLENWINLYKIMIYHNNKFKLIFKDRITRKVHSLSLFVKKKRLKMSILEK